MAATREPYTEVYEDYDDMQSRAKCAAWAFVAALTDGPDGADKAFFDSLYAASAAGDKTINIQFLVNGFYLPFGAVIDEMVKQYDAQVREAAGQIIRDKGLEIVRSADELNTLINAYANKVEEELDVRKP